MEFFDKLSQKANDVYKGAADKTNKIAREAKLKSKINQNKASIEQLYSEMGKKIYEKHIAKNEIIIQGDLDEKCKKIDELSSEIEAFSLEILECRNKKKCSNCSSEIDIDSKFCPKCGAKIEEVVKEQAPSESSNVEEVVNEQASSESSNVEESVKEQVSNESNNSEETINEDSNNNENNEEEKSNLEKTVEVESNPQLN